jgi:hypothetical protein
MSGKGKTFAALVTVAATAFLTTTIGSLFQYVNWVNSTRVSAATSQASKATALYEQTALAIGKRYYSTFLYLAAVRDIVNHPSGEHAIAKFYQDLSRNRLAEFHREIQAWNENYDKLLTSVDFVFDRPFGVVERVENSKILKINCSTNIVDQFGPHDLNYNSLKIQFAAINHCFAESITAFAAEREHAVIDSTYKIDEKIKTEANLSLNNVAAMANEFRCHALYRVQTFEGKKQGVVSPIFWIRGAGVFGRSTSKEFFNSAWENCKLH